MLTTELATVKSLKADVSSVNPSSDEVKFLQWKKKKGEKSLTDTINNKLGKICQKRITIVSPTVCSPTSRVDSPTSNMSVRLRLKLRTMTIIV